MEGMRQHFDVNTWTDQYGWKQAMKGTVLIAFSK